MHARSGDRLTLAAVASLLLVAVSCAAAGQRPAVSVEDVRFRLFEGHVSMNVIVDNPNDFTMVIPRIGTEVYLKAKLLGEGYTEPLTVIRAHDRSVVPVTIRLKLLRAVGASVGSFFGSKAGILRFYVSVGPYRFALDAPWELRDGKPHVLGPALERGLRGSVVTGY